MLNAPISQAVGDTQHRKKKKLTFQKNFSHKCSTNVPAGSSSTGDTWEKIVLGHQRYHKGEYLRIRPRDSRETQFFGLRDIFFPTFSLLLINKEKRSCLKLPQRSDIFEYLRASFNSLNISIITEWYMIHSGKPIANPAITLQTFAKIF